MAPPSTTRVRLRVVALARLCLLIGLCLGCGAPRAHGPIDAPLVLPAAGERFAARLRVDGRFAGVVLPRVSARADLWVLTRRAHEADLRVRVWRGEAFDDVLVRLDGTGAINDLRSLCGDPAVDELSSTRWVRALLATGPLLAHGRPTDRGLVALPIAERMTPISIRERETGDLQGRAVLPLAAHLGGVRYEGELEARVRMRVGSMLLRRTSVRARGEVEATGPDGTRRGALSLALDAQVIRAEGAAPAPECREESAVHGPTDEIAAPACEEPPGGFDMQAVVRRINESRAQITRCYEVELTVRSIRGRVRVSMTIEPSGETTNVRAVENTTGADAVATCVVAEIDTFRFDPAPTCGPMTYAFPFVFEPAL